MPLLMYVRCEYVCSKHYACQCEHVMLYMHLKYVEIWNTLLLLLSVCVILHLKRHDYICVMSNIFSMMTECCCRATA
jgi:hypothetical protein